MSAPNSQKAAKRKPTAKQRVLKAFPEAVCLYDGLLGWHVRNISGGVSIALLSAGFGSSAAAWRDAWRNIQ